MKCHFCSIKLTLAGEPYILDDKETNQELQLCKDCYDELQLIGRKYEQERTTTN